MHQMISVAADPQLCDSESVYLASGIDVQQAGATLIQKEHLVVTEQKLHIAADHEGTRIICVLYLHAEVLSLSLFTCLMNING
jgi:hypothetical protein